MWGNTLGWIISAAIVVLTVAGLVLFQRHLADVTDATELGRQQAAMSLALPIEPASVLPPADDCDAGPIYRQAIELVHRNADAYERFAADGRASREARDLAALELLASAARCARMNLFAASPQQVVRYGPKPELRAIHLAGQCANKLGALLAYEGRTREAIEQHQAAFALGARLYEERLVIDQLLAGMELMSAAAGGIAAASAQLDDAQQAQAMTQFRSAAQQFHLSHITPLHRVLSSIDPGVIERHSGDAFYLARHAQERLWRVEAILALGRLRFHAARVADQQAAMRVLEKLMHDPDPTIRAAAQVARELTIQQYRSL